jgi:hypothetical protein
MIAHFMYLAGALFLALTIFILLVRDDPKKPGEFFDRFLSNCIIIANLLLMLNWFLSLAASCCLLAAPFRNGARGWAIASLGLTALVVLEQYTGLRAMVLGLMSQSERTFMPVAPMMRGGVVGLGISYMFACLPEMMRLWILPMFLRSVGKVHADSSTASFSTYAAFVAPVLFGLALALDLLLNLIDDSKSSSANSRKDEQQALALIMLFLHTMALGLVILANVLILFRARSTLQKAART